MAELRSNERWPRGQSGTAKCVHALRAWQCGLGGAVQAAADHEEADAGDARERKEGAQLRPSETRSTQ